MGLFTNPNLIRQLASAPFIMPSIITTKRLDIHVHKIQRSQELGRQYRTVYQAWFNSEDVPKPICLLTVWEHFKYVEWIWVDDDYRRQGIASEVILAVEDTIGTQLDLVPVTDEGQHLVRKLNRES